MSNFLAAAATPDIEDPDNPGNMIPGPRRYYIERDGQLLTRDLDDPDTDVLYFLIKETGGDNITLNKATLKSGPRDPGDVLEIAITEADGDEIARAQVIVD